jgi:hypothetical protein
MVAPTELVSRRAEALVAEALADTRVVLVNGARQAGKSTLTRLAAARMPGTVIRLLDDPATLRAAADDPTGFVEHDGPGRVAPACGPARRQVRRRLRPLYRPADAAFRQQGPSLAPGCALATDLVTTRMGGVRDHGRRPPRTCWAAAGERRDDCRD